MVILQNIKVEYRDQHRKIAHNFETNKGNKSDVHRAR